MPLTPPTALTSERMRRIRQRDTAPEMVVRRILWQLGHRYRACVSRLPGSPDIANEKRRWAVFIHGCFWHGHRGCKYATVPKSNRQWWLDKLDANRTRDARKRRLLREAGFHVVTVWQCELANSAKLFRKLHDELAPT